MEDKRFSRQAKVGWFDQRKISNANCMIIGCGGIGCWTALQLTMLGIRKLVLVDMDKIEVHNLNRQLFYEKEVGTMKVDALRNKLKEINHEMMISIYDKPIESLPSDAWDNIGYVFDCLDNIPTREYIAKLCWDKKAVFIHSACSDVIGEVQLVVNGKTEPMTGYPESMKVKELKKKCTDFDAAVCTTNMIVASLQVDKFLDYLIKGNVKNPTTNYIRGYGITYG